MRVRMFYVFAASVLLFTACALQPSGKPESAEADMSKAMDKIKNNMMALAKAVNGRDDDAIAAFLPPGRRSPADLGLFMTKYFGVNLDDMELFSVDVSGYHSGSSPGAGRAWARVKATRKLKSTSRAETRFWTVSWIIRGDKVWVQLD